MNTSRTSEIQIPTKSNKELEGGFDEPVSPPPRKQPKWKRYEVKGTPPSPRSGHSAVVSGSTMYIFGGRDGNTFKSDVFAFDLVNHTWTEVATTGARPLPRYGHRAVSYMGQMFVFGGHAATSYLNDLIVLDLETYVWERIDAQGQSPTPRWQHSMVLLRGLLIVFGGCDSTSYLNDLYSYDFERQLWQHIMVDDYSIPPTPRMMHGAVMIRDRMLIFGGQCVDSIKNDFFEFNFELNSWNFIGVAEGRFRRNFSCLEIAGNFFVFGGYSVGLHNDVMIFDFETGTWSTVDIQGKPPVPRSGQTAVPYEERIYIFGGVANDGAQNDVQVLSLGYLAEETSTGNGARVGSLPNEEIMSPNDDWFTGTSPLEVNFLHRFKSPSSVGADREVLNTYNKDESPLILLFREELQKLKAELEDCKKENFELKRELQAMKAERAEENSLFLM